jgi:uncharacterized protein (TIGR02594 family)
MLIRREFIVGAACTVLARPALGANDSDWEAMLREALSTENPTTLGRLMPPKDSPLWAEAQQQLDNAAKNKRPYDIASYFVTSLPQKFQSAWPEPNPASPTLANPLIVLFFLATKTKPSGDKTAWCAAFMNWCLSHASPAIAGTQDAGSQSFLNWGQEVWNKQQSWPPVGARQGDVAVFTLKSDPAHGHVTFFQRATPGQPKHVDVLGGNQFDALGNHTFNVKSLSITSGLELVSIRTLVA